MLLTQGGIARSSYDCFRQQGWNACDWDLPGHLDGPRVVDIALVAKGARPATSSVPGAIALAERVTAGQFRLIGVCSDRPQMDVSTEPEIESMWNVLQRWITTVRR